MTVEVGRNQAQAVEQLIIYCRNAEVAQLAEQPLRKR